MLDKRAYSRIDLSVPAILHDSRQNREISCQVKNISETGVCFQIPLNERYIENIKNNEYIHFQFIDTYMYGKSEETDVLSTDCLIRYVKVDENSMTIGGYVTEKGFQEYASKREILYCIDKMYA